MTRRRWPLALAVCFLGALRADAVRPPSGLHVYPAGGLELRILPLVRDSGTTIDIQMWDSTTPRITRIDCPDYIRITAKRLAFGARNESNYELSVRFLKTAPNGFTDARIRVFTDSKAIGEIPFRYFLRKGILLSDDSVAFGQIPSAMDGPRELPLFLSVYRAHFRVLRVTSDDAHIAVTTQKDSEPSDDTFATVLVSYGGGWPPGPHRASIHIFTDLASQPRIDVPVTAEVTNAPTRS